MKIDQIVRSRRKSFALIIQRDGSLVVRAPLRASDRQIRELVQKKEKWIIAKQEAARQTYATIRPREYVNGENFLYLGKSYKLAIVDGNQPFLTFEDQFYLAKSALPQADAVFKAWYTQQARQIISERAAWYAAQNGFVYQRVNITGARTRWGSCGARGSLNFTWRLVMAPLRVIDYVVVHEVAHLKHKNHSKAYWEEVKRLMPDYQQQIKWLKANGHTLRL
jgi:predicted metal-dependent hydrolase